MRHRWITPALAVALSALPLTAQAAPAPPPQAEPTELTTRITLIIGDRVQVSSRPGHPEKVTAYGLVR